MHFKDKSVLFLATGCFIGNIPFAPGTFGTLLGLPFCFFLSTIDITLAFACIIIFIIFAIYVAHEAEKLLNKDDPGSIVIDEIAGIMVTLAGLPFDAVMIVLGVIFFRVLDIFKPFPIKHIEARLSGGFGIVFDDVLAGVISNLLLRIIIITVGL